PGSYGNVLVQTQVVRSKNISYQHPDPSFGIQVQRAKAGAVVEITVPPATPPVNNTPLVAGNLAIVRVDADGRQSFWRAGAALPAPAVTDLIQLVEMRLTVTVDTERVDVYDELGADPQQKRYIGKI